MINPATVAPGNGGLSPVGSVVEVETLAGGGKGAAQPAFGADGVATTQSVTLWVPEAGADPGAVVLSIAARVSGSNAPTMDGANGRGEVPLPLPPAPVAPAPRTPTGAMVVVVVGGALDARGRTVTFVVIEVVVVDGAAGAAYWMAGGAPSKAFTIPGSVPSMPRAQRPVPRNP